MASQDLSLNYARAFFSLVEEKGLVKESQSALKGISKQFSAYPELRETLSSYGIPKARLYALVDRLYASSSLVDLAPFLKVLVDHHQIGRYDKIEMAFSSLANQALGIKEGLVYSAGALTESQIRRIELALQEKLGFSVSLTNVIEPSIIGGVKVAVDEKVYDGSVAGRIENLRRALLKGGSAI